MELHARIQGEGRPLVLLHGLFGSNENLGTLTRELAGDYSVYALDLRNHGRSPHAETMDFASMAADVHQTMAAHGLDSAAVLGHSLGGKTAMELALGHPQCVERLIVIDIAPVTYTSGNEAELAAMRGLDLRSLHSRGDADEALSEHIASAGVRQFLLKNLARTDDGFAWRIPLDTIESQYPNLAAAPSAAGTYDGPVLVIRGANSMRVPHDAEPAIHERFPHARIETVDAGHWVHIEAPNATLQLVQAFLDSDR